jgi:GT2 family glycosyltransferase
MAIESSNSEYLIFIDSDCIPHKHFLKEHYLNRRKQVCLTGRRVNLSQKITTKLSSELIKRGYLDSFFTFELLIDGLFGKSTDIEKSFYSKSTILRKLFNKKPRGLLGSNFSIHKRDLLDINGFDERFQSYGMEETDLQFRLKLNGVQVKSLNQMAIQYHLFHKTKSSKRDNLDLFESIKREKIPFTPHGIINMEDNK